MLKFINKLLYSIERVSTFLAFVSLFVIVCLTTADAGGRYLFSWPIPGAYEITERYFMVFSFFFAICYAYRTGANIRVTFVVDHLPRQVRLTLNYLVQLLSFFFGVILFLASIIFTLGRIRNSLIIGLDITIPLAPAYIVVVVGLFFMTLRMLLDLWQVKTGKSGLFIEEQETTTSVT